MCYDVYNVRHNADSSYCNCSSGHAFVSHEKRNIPFRISQDSLFSPYRGNFLYYYLYFLSVNRLLRINHLNETPIDIIHRYIVRVKLYALGNQRKVRTTKHNTQSAQCVMHNARTVRTSQNPRSFQLTFVSIINKRPKGYKDVARYLCTLRFVSWHGH